jgi:hypothetical protein
MTNRATPAAVALVLVLSIPALAGIIVVAPGGGGDYATIQEGVDAAADYGDTVIVTPGIYTDVHTLEISGTERVVNVYFEKSITLRSSNGPAVTVVDGGGATELGIYGRPDPDYPFPGDPPPPIIEGFTVQNGISYYPSTGLVAEQGEARGNVVTGYYYGISNTVLPDYTGIPDGGRGRSRIPLIDGNSCSDNEKGIAVIPTEDLVADAVVSNNELLGNNTSGISIQGPDGQVELIGNEIAENQYGVSISSGSSSDTGTMDIDILSNVIRDNSSRNIEVYSEWSYDGHWVHMIIGGAIQYSNDIYGSPINLRLRNYSVEMTVDASYNYWGSVFCDEFEPGFSVLGVPDSSFTYLPFTNESRSTVYEDCGSGAEENSVSWGAIKALYR